MARSFGLAIFLFAALLVFVALPVQAQLSATVWTDKSTYQVGEVVRIIVYVNMRCVAKLTIIKPDGTTLLYTLGRLEAGTYSLTGGADYPLGRRTVILEAWYEHLSTSAYAYFEVVAPPPKTYSVTVRIEGLPSNYSTNVFVDEKPFGTIPGGSSRTFTFDIGTFHKISVDKNINITSDRIYVCKEPTWAFESAGEHRFRYVLLVSLTIDAIDMDTGLREPSGWAFPFPTPRMTFVEAGSTVTLPLPTPEYFWPPGAPLLIKHKFVTWQVNGVNVAGNQPSFVMTQPSLAIARYVQQLQLLVKSRFGTVTGGGFYRKGEYASVSLLLRPCDAHMNGGGGGGGCELFGGRILFKEYVTGVQRLEHGTEVLDGGSYRYSTKVLMDEPKTVEAVFEYDDSVPRLIYSSIYVAATVALALPMFEAHVRIKKTFGMSKR